MRTPKISTKRVLGLGLAVALAVAGTVTFAGASEAAVAAVKPSPSTGASAGGTIVTLTGKDFQTPAGTSKVGAIFFSTAACDISTVATNAATVVSVISPTKITFTSPVLALAATPKPTIYNLCVANAGNSAVVGTAKFTSYIAPFVNTAGVSSTSGATYGGGQITITGENFTTKTTATVGGKLLTGAKVVIGSGTTASANSGDDTLTGTVPAGTGATLPVVVTSEGGPYTATPTFTYLDSLRVVGNNYGNGTDNDVIALSGTGFASRTFTGSATGATAIALVPAGTNVAVGQAVPTSRLCDTVQVEGDTSLSCQINGAVTDGAYTVMMFTRAATATNIATGTAISRSATYTVSDF